MATLPPVDGVYFLMFDGWKRELRSNRWHYASRWARHLPVVLVQPNQVNPSPDVISESETRIANCDILSVKMPRRSGTYGHDMLIQLGQVASDMERRGVRRPLLWLYNPHLLGLYAALPAMMRVFHATENYFDFSGLSAEFLDRYIGSMAISDVVIAVSDGVAASVRDRVPGVKVSVVSNGCDYHRYSSGTANARLLQVAKAYERIAIYGGNVNSRLDFDLIRRCARQYPATCFAFFGRVSDLSPEDSKCWRELPLERNVRYFGEVDADQLPDLYRAADVGIVPYRQTRLLVENGFPLKVLEMCATGLPVVSTLMKPIVGLTRGVVVADGAEMFVRALGKVSRTTMSDADRADMELVCRRHDYDEKFSQVLRITRDEAKSRARPETRLDPLIPDVLRREWRVLGITEWQTWGAGRLGIERVSSRGLDAAFRLYGRIPLQVRHLCPKKIRWWVREKVFDIHW